MEKLVDKEVNWLYYIPILTSKENAMKIDVVVYHIDNRRRAKKLCVHRETTSTLIVNYVIEDLTKKYGPRHEIATVPWVQRINLMGGKPFMEPEDTPRCSSPAFEQYWSM